jgi:hypothetical protein
VDIKPDPSNDGIGLIAYKVTNPSPGVWHYEYALYNQNMDRGFQSFSVPTGNGITLTNIGFHAPPQQPGWAFDGTVGNTGFSSTPWAQTQTPTSMAWATETLAQNPNANAIRWGTLYNFRFDSNRPPQVVSATVGFFKTGAPMQVAILGPTPAAAPAVSVSGRIVLPGGLGVSNAAVSISSTGQPTRTVYTGTFGYYTFGNLPSGVTYTISVTAKRYTFTPQTLSVTDNLTNVDFVAN